MQILKTRKWLETALDRQLGRLFAEGAWIVTGQALAVCGALASVKLLTQWLNPTQYGELSLALTITTVVGQVLFYPLALGIARFYAPAVERRQLSSYLDASSTLARAATLVVSVAATAVACVVAMAGEGRWLGLILTASLLAIVSGCAAILTSVHNAARRRSIAALHQGIDPWLRLVGAMLCIRWLNTSSSAAMLGFAAASSLVLISQYLFYRRIVPSDVPQAPASLANRREIWNFSWPYATSGIFALVQSGSDRWALAQFGTTTDVGLYVVVFQLGYYPISVLTNLLVQLLAPILYQKAGDARDASRNARVTEINRQLAFLAIVATAIVFAGFQLAHGPIFRVLAGPHYTSISYLLPWMALSGGLFAAGQMLSLDLMSQLKTRAMMRVKIVTGVLGLTANFLGAYLFAIPGVVGAGVIFAAAYLAWMAVLVRTHSTRHPLSRGDEVN